MLPPRWKRLAFALLLIWIGVTCLVISPPRCTGGEEAAELAERLQRAALQLQQLKRAQAALLKHINLNSPQGGGSEGAAELQRLLSGAGEGEGEGGGEDGGGEAGAGAGESGAPPPRYEALRRRVLQNTHELWNFAHAELTDLLKDNPQLEPRLKEIIDLIGERKRSLVWDQQALGAADGYGAWREAAARRAARHVQARLRRLQHPPDCRRARKLVCNLNKGCGFGCQAHHIAYCLISAYATERTLVLNSRGWRYNAKGWEYVFKPLSDNCTEIYDDKPQPWSMSSEARVVSLPFIDSLTQKPRFLPLAVPEDLAPLVSRFNGDPASWWVGQMLRYALRPQPHLRATINATIASMPYANPIVGIHVRRTDKVGTEAAFHHLDEYVSKVHDYYDTLPHPPDQRRVYLATDDPTLLSQAVWRHPSVRWVGDAGIARSAGTQRRYAPASLANLLVDITLLSRADYLVCTFSSQVGRLAYELMQTNRADASNSVSSLDDIYYFGGQNAHDRRALISHTAHRPHEISFQEGDLIGVAGNHWNGYGRGTNRRTNQAGLIPWYKTEDCLVTYPFPLHPAAAAPAAPPAPPAPRPEGAAGDD